MSEPSQLQEEMREGHERCLRSKGKDRPSMVNIQDYYFRRNWGDKPHPMPVAGVNELDLVDLTRDKRWVDKIKGRMLAVYRTPNGGHWLLRFDTMFSEHQLHYLGTAMEAEGFFEGRISLLP